MTRLQKHRVLLSGLPTCHRTNNSNCGSIALRAVVARCDATRDGEVSSAAVAPWPECGCSYPRKPKSAEPRQHLPTHKQSIACNHVLQSARSWCPRDGRCYHSHGNCVKRSVHKGIGESVVWLTIGDLSSSRPAATCLCKCTSITTRAHPSIWLTCTSELA